MAVSWARSELRDCFDIIMDSYNQKGFNFYFGADFFSENFAFIFLMLIAEENFIHVSIKDSSHL